MSQKTSKPIAILTSDIHFTVPTLELATSAISQAIKHAESLNVSLVIAGDLHDSKAIIRAEVMNRLLELIPNAKIPVYILRGNHDSLHEKSGEHGLNYLKPWASVVENQSLAQLHGTVTYLIPYQASSEALQAILDTIPKGSLIIGHQGVQSAYMGEYVVDKSSLPPEAFADYRTILGHYHRAQDIKAGRPRKGAVGLISYIGSPYSITFTEAEDGPKGFRVLYDDGTLELIPTNLRKHIKVERTIVDLCKSIDNYVPGDLLWLKVTGAPSELAKIKKKELAAKLGIDANFKLDKIAVEATSVETPSEPETDQTPLALLDQLIDNTGEKEEQKCYLKELSRGLLC